MRFMMLMIPKGYAAAAPGALPDPGAVAAMIIGFVWGGWVTAGTSERNAGVAAQTAVEQAFVPLCVAKAEQQPDQLPLLKKESSYSRKDFVVKAGWVSDVAEKYRRNVAESKGPAPSPDINRRWIMMTEAFHRCDRESSMRPSRQRTPGSRWRSGATSAPRCPSRERRSAR